MTRNLKILGLAALAALALSAAAATAASATDLFTSKSANKKTVLTGTGKTELTVTKPFEAVSCKDETYFGTVDGNAVSSVTIDPAYQECSSELGAVTVHMNGCDYDLSGKTTGEDNEEPDATVSLTCPAGEQMEITAPAGCILRFPPQTPTAGGAVYTFSADPIKHDISATLTATGLTYTSNFICQLGGFPAHANNADLTGQVTITGYEDFGDIETYEYEEGNQIDIEISEEA